MARESTIRYTFDLELAARADAVVETPGVTAAADAVLTIDSADAGWSATPPWYAVGEMIYVDNTGWASLDGKLHMIKSVNSVAGTITIETDTSAEVTARPTPITAIIVHAIEWQEVCFSEFTPNPGTPGEIDTTTMCDTERRNLPGLATPGTANFTGMFDLDDEGMLAVIAAKDAATARFMVGTTRLGQAAVFHGIVSSASIGALTVETAVTFTGTFTLDESPYYMKVAV